MGPEQIRALRGDRSRADFARELGVTPLTVLRWELPDGNKEARRPRRAMIETLEKLVARAVPQAPPFGEVDQALAADLALLVPIRSLLVSAQWTRGEDELLTLLASNQLKTSSGRALATLAMAQQQLLTRLDVRSVLTSVLPLLADVEANKFPPPIAARVHLVAAMVFGAPDARLFDPGRVNAHARAADALLGPDEEERVLLYLAKLSATRFLGVDVFTQLYGELKHLRSESPVPSCLLDLLRSIGLEVMGDPKRAAELRTRALEQAQRLGLHALVVGAYSNSVMFGLYRCTPATEILTLAARARSTAAEARLGPIETLIRVVAAEAEALVRLGRFEDAKVSCKEARELSARAGIPPYISASAEAHLHCFLNDHDGLAQLALALEQEVAPSMRALVRGHALYVKVCAHSLKGEYEQAAAHSDEAFDTIHGVASADYIAHEILFEGMLARMLGTDTQGARANIRRMEALNDRLPSLYHHAFGVRAEALISAMGQVTQRHIEQLEASLAIFVAAEDRVQTALGKATLAFVRHSGGEPGADAEVAASLDEIKRVGFTPRPLARSIVDARQQASEGKLFRFESTLEGRTLAERLSLASELLAQRQTGPEVVQRELLRAAEDLFPGRRAVLQSDSIPPPAPGPAAVEHWFELTDDRGKTLRFGVEGSIDEEQRAALRTLTAVARRTLTTARVRTADTSSYTSEPDVLPELPDLVAAAPPMRRLRKAIAQLSGSRATILVTGESGSGKEVVARAIHDLSTRARRPYVAFNCASVPRELFEGQLFGHKRGAFTGADSDQLGVIRAADKGTLFLDEIGELPLDVQPKLLRFLENGEVFPLGERQPVRVDVRVVAATHRDLAKLVRQGAFREDLFYRLNVLHIDVPPLRDRGEDILQLARTFLRRAAEAEGKGTMSLDDDVMVCLKRYSWPGNVRELEHAITRATVLAAENALTLADLPIKVRGAFFVPVSTPPSVPPSALPNVNVAAPAPELGEDGLDLNATLESVERRLILDALQRTGGNKNRAAALLRIHRTTLVEKLKRMGEPR